MAEGGDSVDSGRKSGVGWRTNIPDVSSLYLGSEEVELRKTMAEGGDSVDSGRKQGNGWRNNLPDVSSLYLGSEEVELRTTMAEGGYSVDSGRKQGNGWRDNIPVSSLYLGSEEVEPLLCREHGQEFRYFCKGHMTELCFTCRKMEHKHCKTVIGIEEAAENIYSKIHGKKIVQSVKDLIDRFKDCKVAAEYLKSLFPNKRELVVDKVRKARKNIDDYLDELEANAIAEIDQNFKNDIDTKEEQIHVCEASLSFLKTSDSDIDRTMSVGNKAEKFIAINRATKQTTQYCNMLLEMSMEMSEINLKFEPNFAFPDIFQSLGTVSVETSQFTDVFTNTTPTYTGEMMVKKNAGDK